MIIFLQSLISTSVHFRITTRHVFCVEVECLCSVKPIFSVKAKLDIRIVPYFDTFIRLLFLSCEIIKLWYKGITSSFYIHI